MLSNRFRKALYRILGIMLVVVAVCSTILNNPGSACAEARRKDTLKVGFYYLPGFNDYNDKGMPVGFNNEFLQRLSLYTDWDYVFTGYEVGLEENFAMLERGEIDFLPCVSKTPERERNYLFSNKQIAFSATNITARESDFRFRDNNNFYKYENLRVGLLKGSYRNDTFAQKAAERKMQYIPVYFNTIREMEQALTENNTVDLIVTNSVRPLGGERTLEQYDFRNMYIIYRQGNEALRDRIDAQIEEMDRSNPMWRRDMWNRYGAQSLGDHLSLSLKELEFLEKLKAEGKELTVLAPRNRLPLSSLENDKYVGVMPDVFAEIARRLGIKYRYLQVEDQNAYYHALLNGEADVVLGMYQDYAMKAQEQYYLTSPYMNLDIALVYRNNSNNKKYAVSDYYNKNIRNILNRDLPLDAQIEYYDNPNDCVTALLKGDVDHTFAVTYAAQLIVANDKSNSLNMRIIPGSNIPICLGVSKQNDSLLASIMEKAALGIKENYIDQYMLEHNLMVRTEPELKDLIYLYPVVTASFLVMLVAAIGAGVVLYQRNKSLHVIMGQRQELNTSKETMNQLQKAMHNGFWSVLYDKQGNVISQSMGQEFREILHFTDEKKYPSIIDISNTRIHPEDREKELEERNSAWNTDVNRNYEAIYRMLNGDDVYVWVKTVARSVFNDDGSRLVVGYSMDITDEYNYDHLTDAYNRYGFINDLDKMLAADRLEGMAICFFNIRGFKSINELWGYSEGDKLLVFYYKQLHSILMPMMIGRKEDHFFCLIAMNQENLDKIEQLCHMQYQISDYPMYVPSNCGIYPIVGDESNASSMLDKAQLAKNAITDEYVKPYAIYDEQLQKEYIDASFVNNEIHKAIEEKQFEVYYQPIVDCQTGKITSAEALVRWQHPERGTIQPSVFVPVLEQSGYISAVDKQVVQTVCAMYDRQVAKGKPEVPVSMNMSWMDFYDKELLQWILNYTLNSKLPDGLFRCEITESSYAALNNNVADIIGKMKELKIKLLLDDFGTGYSSLDMLQTYSFDILKIDMSFTRKIGVNLKTNSLLQAIIDMCHQMGMKVIAEGVETREQLDFYRENKCDYIQGYYFYQPMNEQEFEALLEEQATMNAVVDFRSAKDLLPNSYYKGYIFFPNEEMRQLANTVPETILRLIGTNGGVGTVSGIYDSDFSICYFSNLLVELLGFNNEEFLERSQGKYLNLIAPEDRERYCMDSSIVRYYGLVRKDGSICNVKEMRTDVRNSKGERQWVAAIHGIEELTNEEMATMAQLANVVETDSFTHLLTKNAFFHQMDVLLDNEPDMPCSLMIIDIDNFKTVNDKCGHIVGDETILKLTDILRNTFRSGDLIGRFGGDEFMVFMKGCNDKDLVEKRAESILRKISTSLYYEELHRPCTVSIGVVCSDETTTRTELFKMSDRALYKAKDQGKNTYKFFEFE